MRSKTVTVHYCDFCKARRFMRPAMIKHEAGCTANPDRICKMCLMRAQWDEDAPKQKPPVETATLIDSFDPYAPGYDEADAEREIRKFVGDCPACLLAGSRQSKTGLPFNFDWKVESKAWLGEYCETSLP